jgi:hypothetical protein
MHNLSIGTIKLKYSWQIIRGLCLKSELPEKDISDVVVQCR